MMSTDEILKKYGLDFNIRKEQLQTSIGEETPYYALINDKSGECLNSVKSGYTVSQNKEILDLVLQGMDQFDNLEVSRAGALNGGAKTFIQLGVKGMHRVLNEEIKRYVTIIDSNDGSSSLSVGVGDVVMSCDNQFFQFSKKGQSKYRHTASLERRVNELPNLIEDTLESMILLDKKYASFMSNELSKELAKKAVDKLSNKLIKVDKSMSKKELDDMSSRKSNQMDSLYGHLNKEMSDKGDNLFGLFSGVTSWTTHDRSAPKREHGRVESLMTGSGYKMNDSAFKFVEEVLENS